MDANEISSPRARGAFCGLTDTSELLSIEEREEVGRYLRLMRPVRRGEAILVEDPLFLSPRDAEELQVLLDDLCDSSAMAQRAASSGQGSHGLSGSEQLSLVVAQAFIRDQEAPNCEELRQLRGDQERWKGPAVRLWSLMKEEYRCIFTAEAMSEVFAIVASNAHQAEDGRIGLFRLGSYAEHSCAPSAYKEVVASQPVLSPPGSPVRSPSKGPSLGMGEPRQLESPQLVLRAHRDLDEGDIVSISYISEYLPTWVRRQQLQAGYGFTCGCTRCLHQPEVTCAYRCFTCGGPLSPTGPMTSIDSLLSSTMTCEDCGLLTAAEDSSFTVTVDPASFAAIVEAERSEVMTQAVSEVLHPFHYRIFGMYLSNMQAIEASQRIEAIEQMIEAKRRQITSGDASPLVSRLVEHIATSFLELGDYQQALANFRKAQELYAISHRGLPDPGHDRRCYEQQVLITAGPLGTPSRRNSRILTSFMTRSLSLPSLAEVEEEPVAGAS